MKTTLSQYLLIFLSFLFISSVYSQNPEWINYTCSWEILAIAKEGNYLWIGSQGGVAKIDITSGDSTFYNKANSGLPYNRVSSIAVDDSGNKWIGTLDEGYLAKFDGTNWTAYNASNSGLPDKSIMSIAIDSTGAKWIGTVNGGLVKFVGTYWTV